MGRTDATQPHDEHSYHWWRLRCSVEHARATTTTAPTAHPTPPEETTAPDGTDAPDDTVEVVQADESTLDAVQSAGVFRCGTRNDLPGFATLDDAGEHVGFDSDFCRVIAAAVLGDATAVEMVDLETADRFTALQSGEVDALVRNTTWTATRDGAEGATFVQPNFYDGQGMMVAADSGFASLADMDGVIVCVAQGTTTEGNAAAEAGPPRSHLGSAPVRERRPHPGGIHRRSVRWLVVRHEPAHRPALDVPRRS